MINVVFDISAHGFGHLAQTAPVITRWNRDHISSRIVVRSGLPEARLRARIAAPFEFWHGEDGFGLEMSSPFEVQMTATADRYKQLHQHFDQHVSQLTGELLQRDIDVVVSNAGYMILVAAAKAKIASLAFGSINWRDVTAHYCHGYPGMDGVLASMTAAYCGAGRFLRLSPGIAMPGFNEQVIAKPIVSLGQCRRAELADRFSLAPGAAIAVFGFDAAAHVRPEALLADKRLEPGKVLLLGPTNWNLIAPWASFDEASISFLDAMWSADLAIAKPGYGLVTEAAAAGTPLVLLGRRDWPETAAFLKWLQGRLPCQHFDTALDSLSFDQIAHLLKDRSEPSRIPPAGDGACEIVAAIHRLATQPHHGS